MAAVKRSVLMVRGDVRFAGQWAAEVTTKPLFLKQARRADEQPLYSS